MCERHHTLIVFSHVMNVFVFCVLSLVFQTCLAQQSVVAATGYEFDCSRFGVTLNSGRAILFEDYYPNRAIAIHLTLDDFKAIDSILDSLGFWQLPDSILPPVVIDPKVGDRIIQLGGERSSHYYFHSPTREKRLYVEYPVTDDIGNKEYAFYKALKRILATKHGYVDLWRTKYTWRLKR